MSLKFGDALAGSNIPNNDHSKLSRFKSGSRDKIAVGRKCHGHTRRQKRTMGKFTGLADQCTFFSRGQLPKAERAFIADGSQASTVGADLQSANSGEVPGARVKIPPSQMRW